MSELRPQVDPHVWAERYRLKLERRFCQMCGKETTPAPVAFGDMRGFSYDCADHPNHSAFSGSPIPGSESDNLWADVFGKPRRPKRKRVSGKARSGTVAGEGDGG